MIMDNNELYIRYKVRIASLEQENAKLKEQLEICIEALKNISECFKPKYENIEAQQALKKLTALNK